MAVLPLPSSVKFPPFNAQFWKNRPSAVVTASSSNTKTMNKIPKFILLNKPSYTSTAALHQFLIKQTDRETGFYGLKSGEEDESIEEAIRSLIQRLETAVEGIVELEVEKFKGKVRENLSSEEIAMVKKMSREIASKILERPMNYLRTKDMKLEETLKEMDLLLRVFQNSSSGNSCINH